MVNFNGKLSPLFSKRLEVVLNTPEQVGVEWCSGFHIGIIHGFPRYNIPCRIPILCLTTFPYRRSHPPRIDYQPLAKATKRVY